MMATRKRTRTAYRPAARDGDGHWLCNVVDDCQAVAVQQASPETLDTCSGGGCNAGSELLANVEQRRTELDAVNAREESILAAAKSAREQQERAEADAAQMRAMGVDVPVPPSRAVQDLLDQVELRAIAERRQILGAELEAIEAAHKRVVDDHTHPLFACDKHVSKLPK